MYLVLFIVLMLFMIPILVYMCVKWGTFAYYRAKWLAQKYNKVQTKEQEDA